MRSKDAAANGRSIRPIEIKRIDAIPVAIPLKKPMKMASVEVRTADNLLVRIESKDGTVGWGEAASAPVLTGETRSAMVAAVKEVFAPLLLGKDARDRAALVRRIGNAAYVNTGAKSAIEIALADLVGRTLGVPFTDLYGGALRQSVKPMYLLGNATVQEDIAEARQKHKEGIDLFKLKVGVKGVEAEIENALAVRDALGPKVLLCADANTGYDYATADRYLTGVKSMSLAFLEQPMKPKELGALARLARNHATPIGCDEAIHGNDDIEANSAHGASGLSLKLIKFGGPTGLLSAAALCEKKGLEMNLAAKIAESSIAAVASGHMACMIPSCNWGVSLTHVYLADDLVKQPLKLIDGVFTPPVGAGLGVEVDEAAVEKYTVR